MGFINGLAKDKSPQEREMFLKSNADAVVNKTYMRSFTPEEIQQHKESYTDTAIKMAKIKSEMDDVVRQFKDELKPLADSQAKTLEKIEAKAEKVEEPCYKFVVAEENTTYFINRDGDCIEARRCTADEMQGTIHQTLRANGTDNY